MDIFGGLDIEPGALFYPHNNPLRSVLLSYFKDVEMKEEKLSNTHNCLFVEQGNKNPGPIPKPKLLSQG